LEHEVYFHYATMNTVAELCIKWWQVQGWGNLSVSCLECYKLGMRHSAVFWLRIFITST